MKPAGVRRKYLVLNTHSMSGAPSSSWANIASTAPAPSKSTCIEDEHDHRSVAVIDANAIITHRSGLMNLVQSYDRIVTIPEVIAEVRDGQSRQALQSLPFKIETLTPSEESMRAVGAFARATGDLHALSSVDMKLIALARTIEVEYYGEDHLRKEPSRVRAQRRPVDYSKHLPGWGVMGGTWEAIDEINREEEEAARAAILGEGVEVMTATDSMGDLQLADGDKEAGMDGDEQGIDEGREESTGGARGEVSEEQDEDEDAWETAYKNKGKARRKKKAQLRRREREEEAAREEEDAREAMEETDGPGDGAEDAACASDLGEDDVLPHPAGQSNVISMTADFAMQNVILQMGLALAAPDGRQISSVSRFVLRCTACQQVTKEMGRVFCPKCGNATLDRVKITTGADGAELVGVRRKHILRGTKFSLPKPKGGRNYGPITREDELLTKKHLLRAKKSSAKAQLDPFAPEFTDETWHQVGAIQANPTLGSLLNTGWKKNPNERKHVATNRRRK